MPPIDTPIWVDVLLLVGAGAAALTAIVKAWTTAVLPYLVRPVSTAVNAAMDRLVEEHLGPIKAELETNGGTSLKDAVLRIERQQRVLSTYTHQSFNDIIGHLSIRNQADPALQLLRDRLRDAETTGEMKQILRDQLPDVIDDEGSY